MGGALLNWVGALIKNTPESTFPFCHVKTQRKTAYDPRKGFSTDIILSVVLITDFSDSRTVGNRLMLFISYLVCGVLLLGRSKSGDLLFMLLTSYPQSHLF